MSSYFFTFSGLGTFAALAVILSLPFFQHLRRRWRTPFVYYSQLSDLPTSSSTASYQRWSTLPDKLFLATLVFFALGLTDVRLLLPPSGPPSGEALAHPQTIRTPTEGIALYFVIDVSGSMAAQVPFEGPDGAEIVPKIDLVKGLIEKFIEGDPQLGFEGRSDDLIGLVAFARQANILSPLTLDHEAIIDRLRKLTVVKDESLDGTGIGYAIYKTASIIAATRHFAEQLPKTQKPAYDIKSTAMILVTDGFQSPNPLDKGNWMRTLGMEDAARFAEEQGIKLYLIDIEPSLAKPEFEPHRHLLTHVAEMTGGKFFLAESFDAIPDIYHQVDQLEKSTLPVETALQIKDGRSVGPHREVLFAALLVACGLLCLAGAVALETIYLRVVP